MHSLLVPRGVGLAQGTERDVPLPKAQDVAFRHARRERYSVLEPVGFGVRSGGIESSRPGGMEGRE